MSQNLSTPPVMAPHPLPASTSNSALECPLPIGRSALLKSDVALAVTSDNINDVDGLDSKPPAAGLRGSYLQLRVGVTWRHMCTFFYASLITISAVVFMNAVQPYVFAQLGLANEASQGSLLSYTLLAQEFTVIATASLWGSISDKFGRKLVYVVGMLLLAIGTLVLIWVRSFALLLVARIVFAVGSAATLSMLTALLADYPADNSRGKSGGVIGLTAGLGALLALFAFAQIPAVVTRAGLSTSLAGALMFATVASVLALSAIGLGWGLGSHKPVAAHATILHILRDGIAAARNPRILLAYLAGFASRGDAVAITSFLSLWINDFETARGVGAAKALAAAGIISGVAQTMAIVGAPFVGVLADKIDRALCLTLSSVWAMLAYAILFSVPTPDGWLIYFAAVAVGLGEIFMIVSAQVLIASEAPPSVRGSVGGCFGLLGSVSILVTSFLGGYLYDNWRPTAPFGLISCCNAIVVLTGLGVLLDSWRKGSFNWRGPVVVREESAEERRSLVDPSIQM